MRINIYAEELTDNAEVTRVSTVTDNGNEFSGIRFFLKSADSLHHTADDDDRSAVTFWGPRAQLAALLRKAADEIDWPTSGGRE